MELKFKRLDITNFRNINELKINFNDCVTEIKAENGKGKTNTLSAILWCLFGKNIYDEKAFVISPIIDGVEHNEITTNVTITFTNNYVISRSYQNRKTKLQTGYEFDGVAQLVDITQRDFEEELREKMVDLETFKSLSNINYLPNLNWKDLKQLILDLIGDIKDEEILLKGDFDLVDEQIRLMGINSTADALKSSDTTLNTQIKAKESEYQTLLNTKDKYVVESEESIELQKEKEELLKKIEHVEEIKKQNEEKENIISKYNKLIDELKIKKSYCEKTIENNKKEIERMNELYSAYSSNVDVIREQEINGYKIKQNSVSTQIKMLSQQNESLGDKLKEIKQKGEELKQQEPKIENDKCSTCGQILPDEIINLTLEKLKQERLEELKKLKSEYDNTKTVIDCNFAKIGEFNYQLSELDELIENAKTKEINVEQENDKQKEVRIQRERLELELNSMPSEIQKIDDSIKHEEELFKSMEIKLEIVPDVSSVVSRLNEINEKLATTITLSKIQEDVDNAAKELENLRNNKVIIKNKLEQVAKFNNLKSDMLREKAKSNFNIVDFKTREFTQDGVEQETFKICINGIDYKELNTGLKILVAIDLVSGIQKLKDISIPILVDNAESVTNDISINHTQLVIARATQGIKELEIK